LQRVRLWKDAGIKVQGRPDWIFIKLHCHGMVSQDEPSMTGESIRHFLRELVESSQNGVEYRLHFVTMGEMVNIALAACDGGQGNRPLTIAIIVSDSFMLLRKFNLYARKNSRVEEKEKNVPGGLDNCRSVGHKVL
jgi:hypothetical protein